MADNITEVLKALMSDMDKKAMSEALPQFKKLISTPEGQELTRKIKNADRASLIKLLTNLKSGGNPTDSLKKASENPEYIKNLSKLLDKEV